MRKLSSYPKNVPRALIRAYRLAGENGLKLSKQLGVNDAHISKLLKYGIEPKDWRIRVKLFLPAHPVCKCCGRKIINRTKPAKGMSNALLQEWKHLPTDERQRVIKEYLTWKKTKLSKE